MLIIRLIKKDMIRTIAALGAFSVLGHAEARNNLSMTPPMGWM